MTQKRALITGVGGQDGSYLAELLLTKGYDVHGIIRRQSVAENQDARVRHLEGPAKFHYGDVTDAYSLDRIFREVQPDLIFNLAAQSHVRISSDMPAFTVQTNGVGVLNVLETMRHACPGARLYQASSSEMFGTSIDANGYQCETTPMTPTSPYGCAKLLGYALVRHYRAAYGLFATNGILFNHESPRRGANFVSRKIVKGAVEIKLGARDSLRLGNLDAYRDWGHAKDYVKAMLLIIEHSKPDDFVIATGVTRSIREMVEYVFRKLELDPHQFIKQDKKFLRPQELPHLRGDASKARVALGWAPSYSFETLLDEMIDSELAQKGTSS